jgi:NADH-quinone oxidoreductase subunit N
METSMAQDLQRLLPELFLAGGAVFGLLLGSYLPRRLQWLVRLLAALACAGGLVATVADRSAGSVFDDTYAIDVATTATRVVVLVSVLFVLGLATALVRGHRRETEFVVLLLLGALGAIMLAGANDLLLLAAAYLLASVPLYALTGFAKDGPGTEATLKFYLMGALLGVTMVFGVMIVFGVGGATDYASLHGSRPTTAVVAVGAVLVLAGLLFKAGAVPAHFWVPDVTEGAPPAVGALVTTIPKIGAVVAVYRFASVLEPTDLNWPLLFAVLAAVTMTLGNLAAFFQTNVRRLLAYSTISQVGYLLMAVAAAERASLALPSLLLYLGAYAVTNLGAFAVVCALPRATTIADYRGLLRRHRWLAIGLVVCLLGLVGTPPTGVFMGKLTIFTAAFDAGLGWLVVIAAVNTVASLFYYLRWLAPAMRADPVPSDRADRWASATAYVAAPLSVALGPVAGILLAVVQGDLFLH